MGRGVTFPAAAEWEVVECNSPRMRQIVSELSSGGFIGGSNRIDDATKRKTSLNSRQDLTRRVDTRIIMIGSVQWVVAEECGVEYICSDTEMETICPMATTNSAMAMRFLMIFHRHRIR